MTQLFPLSAAQMQFWTGHQLAGDSPLYNMAWRFDLSVALDPARFAQAVQDVALTSDALRAVFQDVDGTPTQSRGPVVPFPEPLKADVDALPDLIEQLIVGPFDLSRCTYRQALIQLAPDHWVWIFVQHHIACDAQSGSVLLDAVSGRYEDLGQASSPPPDQPSFFKGLIPAEQSVKRAPALGNFPYGAKRGTDPRSDRVSVPFAAGPLNALADRTGFKLFTPDLSRYGLYLTLYIAFIARITGDAEVTVGTPSHNRLNTQNRETLGLFVEVLPIGAPVASDDSFATLHAKVKVALGRFLRTAKLGGLDAAGQSGFAYILNYVQAKFGDFAGAPVTAEWIHPGAHDAQHGLRLHVTDFDGSGDARLAFDVNCAVADQMAAEDIAGHFARFASAMIENPEAKIATVALIRDPATSVEGQAQEGDLPSVLHQILDHAKFAPDQIAVEQGDAALSYGVLMKRAARLAVALADVGVEPGQGVTVHMARSIDYVIAVLGTLVAGAHFVPIAASNPAARAKDIARRAPAAAIIADAARRDVFVGLDIPVLDVENADDGSDDPPHLPMGDHCAYIIFTSGSTGTPKGVAIDHDGLARYIAWAASEFGGPDYPLFTSISFDLTITSLFVPLTQGGRLVIYPEAETGPDLAVLDVFAQDRVDTVKLTPAHLSLVCQAGHRVSRIGTLVLGGENLSAGLCRRGQDVLGPVRILNEYGPTEAVVGCMIHTFDRQTDTAPSVPIGQPAAGITISLRDDGMNPVPTGVTGQICIAGRLAKGYTDTSLTAQKFVDLPQRTYLSGDLGRLRPDGVFEYLGRADEQSKQGGVRVEPAEVETALLEISGVTAAFVGQPAAQNTKMHCTRCGLAADYPDAVFDEEGQCHICSQFDDYKDRAEVYFPPSAELTAKIEDAKAKRTGDYDVIMLLSGGKDSTYAAYRLAELSKNVLALTLDNGFLSAEAMTNIKRVTDHLGWDQQFMTTPAMNEIFVDSLKRHSNVCNGCFKTVYTLALREARTRGIPAIVTGLSRGQFFETRLTPELFQQAAPSRSELEAIVSDARKRYHAEDDAIAKHLGTDDIRDGAILNEVEIIDLYRYIDVSVSEIYRYLSHHAPWQRPSDTGRSTNCLINDLGIYFHRKREGFHNYALPYSWDVRMGHKTRAEAMGELDDEIDDSRMEDMLQKIGFDEPVERSGLIAYVTANISTAEIWEGLRRALPSEMLPTDIVALDQIPITPNGKVDRAALPRPRVGSTSTSTDWTPPGTPTETLLANIFGDLLGVDQIGIHEDFFDRGVDSLAAVKIAMAATEAGLSVPPTALFQHRSVAALAAFADQQQDIAPADPMGSDDLIDLDTIDLDALSKALR